MKPEIEWARLTTCGQITENAFQYQMEKATDDESIETIQT